MCPTSIAVWNAEAPAALGARVALARLADVGEARLEVASVLDPAQMPAASGSRRRRTGPLAGRLVGEDLAARTRPGRSSPGRRRTPAGSPPPSPAGRPRPARPLVFASSSRSSPRTSASTSVPSCFHDRHRLRGRRRVDAEDLGERVDRRHAGRLDLGRRVEPLGELAARAGCRARPRGRRRSRRSRT